MPAAKQDSMPAAKQDSTPAAKQDSMPAASVSQPAVFVNHGGGPLPLLGQQPSIAAALRSYASTLDERPKAIVLIDAHWECDAVTVSCLAPPCLVHAHVGLHLCTPLHPTCR